jgi:phasin family protein
MQRSDFTRAANARRTDADTAAIDALDAGAETAAAAAPLEALAACANAARFATENIEALVRASTAVNTMLATVSQSWSTLAQANLEASASTAAALCGARSLPEAVALQSDFARSAFERLVAEGTKVAASSIAAGKEAFEPIHARATDALVTLAKPVEQLLNKSLRAVA